MAESVRSTSASVVRQFETEIRSTARPCQGDGVIQAVPSASSRRGHRSGPLVRAEGDHHLGEHHVVEHLDALDRGQPVGELPGARREPFDQLDDAAPPERAQRRPDRDAASPPGELGHLLERVRPLVLRCRYAACIPDRARRARGASATIATPQSYGTFSVLCASVAQESARSSPATSCSQARRGGRPQPERAVDVHPGAMLVGELDRVGHRVERAGVQVAGLQADDRRAVGTAVERVGQRVERGSGPGRRPARRRSAPPSPRYRSARSIVLVPLLADEHRDRRRAGQAVRPRRPSRPARARRGGPPRGR